MPTTAPDKLPMLLKADRVNDADSLVTALRRIIRDGDMATGQKLPSERQLANQLSLPRAVVRASLSQLEREGLLECTHGSGRQVAESKRRLDLGVIAVVTAAEISPQAKPPLPPWSSYQAGAALSALQHAAQSALVIHPNRLIEHGAAWLTRRDVLGLLVMQCDAEDVDLIPTLLDAQSAGVQVVAYGSDRDARPWDRVVSDHAAGAAKLTRWLIEQGRRRVLRFWRFPEPRPWRLERDRGHELAMRELGMDPLPAVVTASPANSDRDALYQDEEYEGLIAMIMGYLYPYLRGGREPIDAIMTATDRHALEVGEAVTRLGLRPGIDVAIVGYDHSYPYLMDGYPGAIPPAATADKNNDRIGRAMCDLLLARLRNELPADPQVVAVDPSLIVGHPADASISQDSTPFSS